MIAGRPLEPGDSAGNLELDPGPPSLSFPAVPAAGETIAGRQASAQMDLKLIHRLIRLMNRGELTELEIDDEQAGLRIRLKRGRAGTEPSHSPLMGIMQGAPLVAPVAIAPTAAPAGAAEVAARLAGTLEIRSPMVGTFYRSVSPEAEPFTHSGARIGPESIVCIIEAMKVMNEIKAETSGEIVEILVENGEPVEYGQPLFLVKPL